MPCTTGNLPHLEQNEVSRLMATLSVCRLHKTGYPTQIETQNPVGDAEKEAEKSTGRRAKTHCQNIPLQVLRNFQSPN
jgi:hypothetical protein